MKVYKDVLFKVVFFLLLIVHAVLSIELYIHGSYTILFNVRIGFVLILSAFTVLTFILKVRKIYTGLKVYWCMLVVSYSYGALGLLGNGFLPFYKFFLILGAPLYFEGIIGLAYGWIGLFVVYTVLKRQ